MLSCRLDPAPDNPEITRLLSLWSQGDRAALDQLSPVVHAELRRIAASYLRRERGDHTLQPTALINEAYLRLIGHDVPTFNSRAHFFGIAANLMRQILVEHARKRRAARRDGGVRADLAEAESLEIAQCEQVLSVHNALDRLAVPDARAARIVGCDR